MGTWLLFPSMGDKAVPQPMSLSRQIAMTKLYLTVTNTLETKCVKPQQKQIKKKLSKEMKGEKIEQTFRTKTNKQKNPNKQMNERKISKYKLRSRVEVMEKKICEI